VNKKEAKKTLIPVGCGTAGATSARSGAKVFCFFFSKKKTFLLHRAHLPYVTPHGILAAENTSANEPGGVGIPL
jgi:hypothetical protein